MSIYFNSGRDDEFDLTREPRNSIGNFRQKALNTNIASIPATTTPGIFWHTLAKRDVSLACFRSGKVVLPGSAKERRLTN
ncbi:MAG: hypothetical protein WCB11_21260 [Terriglobales bacterium]